jgi:hypothetical protein
MDLNLEAPESALIITITVNKLDPLSNQPVSVATSVILQRVLGHHNITLLFQIKLDVPLHFQHELRTLLLTFRTLRPPVVLLRSNIRLSIFAVSCSSDLTLGRPSYWRLY